MLFYLYTDTCSFYESQVLSVQNQWYGRYSAVLVTSVAKKLWRFFKPSRTKLFLFFTNTDWPLKTLIWVLPTFENHLNFRYEPPYQVFIDHKMQGFFIVYLGGVRIFNCRLRTLSLRNSVMLQERNLTFHVKKRWF